MSDYTNEWSQSEYHGSKTLQEWIESIEKREWLMHRVRDELASDFNEHARFAKPRRSLNRFISRLLPDEDLAAGPFDYRDERNGSKIHSESVRRYIENTYDNPRVRFWYSLPRHETLSLIVPYLQNNGYLSWVSTHDHKVAKDDIESECECGDVECERNYNLFGAAVWGTYVSETFRTNEMIQRYLMVHRIGTEPFLRVRRLEFRYFRDGTPVHEFVSNIGRALWDQPMINDGVVFYNQVECRGYFLDEGHQLLPSTRRYTDPTFGLSKKRRCISFTENVGNRRDRYHLVHTPTMVKQTRMLMNSIPPFFG